MSAAEVLGLVALVVGLAVAAEMVGDRIGLPNFLFFILAGVAVGPVGLDLVHHDAFGDGLEVIVGLGVAIIIFHSGTGITREALRTAPRALVALATVGVLVTFLGAAAVTYLVMDVPPGIAVLVGALLVATGTTVIEPLLEAVPVPDELAYTLEIEATVTEVSAGVLAVAAFHAITVGEPESGEFVFTFAWILLVGILIGAAVAAGVWVLFQKPRHAPSRAPKHASQLFLATAVVTYAAAETVAQEAGVPAVATAGILLGNADLPYAERVDEFEENVTTFIISFIFVVLASFVDPEWLVTVGLEGVVVAVAVIVVVRPLAVFLSTARSALSTREKLFLSVASPRGIIPAGIATLLAISIQDSNPTSAAYITGTVLLVILVSSLVEGAFAGRVAERFGLTVDTTVIVGGGRLGLALATQYEERGERVIVVETDEETLEQARIAGFTAYLGDGTDEDALRNAGVERASRVVAATADDATNYEIARLAESAFDVDTILVRIDHADERATFEDLDVELLTGSQLDLWALEHLTARPAPDWLNALTRTGGVRSVSVPDGLATTVADLDRTLPERAFVVALSRDGRTWIPDGSESVAAGDVLTLLGRSEAVEEGADRLASPPSDIVGEAADDRRGG